MNMSTSISITENEFFSTVPPFICNNPREKVEALEAPVHDVLKYQKYTAECREDRIALRKSRDSTLPVPHYPLSVEWSPSVILFDMDNTFIIKKIRIWNACSRSIYVCCCGLWGDTARLGASWRCYPRTRFLLSPGLTAVLYIQATPKEHSPIPSAQLAIQIAAAHKRDTVVGYFVIPIIVKFHKYIMPCLGELEESNNSVAT